MQNEQNIPLDGATKVVVEEAHGDLSVQGWEHPSAQVTGADDVQVHRDGGTLLLQLHGDSQLLLPHQLELVVTTVHGDLDVAQLPNSLQLHDVRGDLQLTNVGTVHGHKVDGDLHAQGVADSLTIEQTGGDLEVRTVAGGVDLAKVGGDARIHTVDTVRAGNIQGDLTLREARGSVQVENVGGDLRTSHLHGDCRTNVGGDLKAGFIRGNLDCSVGGDAVVRVMPQGEQAYRIRAGGDIQCRIAADADLAINANSGGGIRVKNLPIQLSSGAHTLQAVLGNGAAALDLTAGGDITLTNREQEVEWEFNFNEVNEDLFDEIGQKAAAHAERIAQQMEEQMAQFTSNLDEKFAQFGSSEEFATKIQAKVQNAMQRAEAKVAEAMQRAEQRARDAEQWTAERHARYGRHGRRGRRGRHGEEPMTPMTPPAAPAEPAVSSEERMMILKMLSEGQISVEQADQLLAALGGKAPAAE